MIRFTSNSAASFFLLFSTAVAWYEGSTILDNSLEWQYSTPFTQLLYGVVNNPSDISQLDYFVYAAKFQPTFPIIMVLSSLYLLILIGYSILKQEKKWVCLLSYLFRRRIAFYLVILLLNLQRSVVIYYFLFS